MNTDSETITESESTNTALMPLEKKNAVQFFVPNGLDPILAKLRSEVEAYTPDISTKAGREVVASFAYKLARSKTAIDKLGKEVVAGMKERVKVVDAERARAWDEIEKMQAAVRKPLTDWEEAEKARVAAHETALAEIEQVGTNATTSLDFNAAIEEVNKFYDRDWQEFKERAHAAIDQRESLLRLHRDKEQKAEQEREELARLRREEEARKQKERDEELQRQAAEKARREAEEKAAAEAKAAAEKAEREKREIEERAAAEKKAREDAERRAAEEKARAEKAEADAKAAAEKAEADRIVALARAETERKDAERRAAEKERLRIADEQAKAAAEIQRRNADKAHREKIIEEIAEGIAHVRGDHVGSHELAEAIAEDKIPHVTINY